MDACFTAQYTPRHANTLDCQRHAARYVRPARGRYTPLLVLAALVLAVNVGLDLIYSEAVQTSLAARIGRPMVEAIAPLTAILILTAAFILWLRGRGKRQLRRLESEFPHPPVRFAATEERLEWENAHSGSWLDYSTIDRVFATPNALGVMHNGAIVPIPRDAFDSRIGEFLRFLLDRIPETARKNSLEDKGVRDLIAAGSPEGGR